MEGVLEGGWLCLLLAILVAAIPADERRLREGRGGLSEGNDRGCLGKGEMERKKKRILMGGNRAGRRGVNK